MSDFRRYTASILGESYTFVSDEAEDEFARSVSRVDKLVREISEKSVGIDQKRIAVLVALQISSQVNALENKLANYTQKESELIKSIEREFADSF